MEADTNDFCCGCFSSDRKMKPLNNLLSDKAFLKIFIEIPIQMDTFSMWLCWECETRVSNFIKFKAQLANCWNILQDYVKKIHNTHPQSISKLAIASQQCIDTNTVENIQTDNVDTQIDIKPLNDAEVTVKIEEHYSDEDRSLIDIYNEEKNLQKRKPKKGKKVKSKNKQKQTDNMTNKYKEEEVMFEEIKLSNEEILEERACLAAKEEYVNAMFKCEKCIIPYANEDDLKDHELAKHSLSSKHTCEYCSRGFPSGGALAVHRRRHAVRWQCIACRHRSAAALAAVTHYTTNHRAGELFDLAAKAFGSHEENTQNGENSRPKSSEQIPCQYCEKTFGWKTSLRKHMEAHRIEAGHKRRPHCEPCGLAFTTSSNLRKHVKTSSKHQIQLKLRKLKEAPAECEASRQAQDIAAIKSSVLQQKQQFSCPQCEKKFQWKGNLWRHLQSHAARANGELVCAPCKRTFSSIATYKQHMAVSRKHVTEDDFKYMCSDCGKRFSDKTKLRDHIDWEHLKNYTHTCTHCQKVFKSHTSLYLHRQVVHRLYNADHLCDHCGKSFPNKTKLRSHVTALHTREAPFKCTTCSARFSWHSCLSRHVRRVHRTKPSPD